MKNVLSYIFLLQVYETVTTTQALVVGNIKIVGQSGGVAQFLPGSYVDTIPRWTVEGNEEDPSIISLQPLIGTSASAIGSGSGSESESESNIQSFVNPTSNEELWWPSDLKTIEVRPTLDVFLSRGAVPSYLLAGVEVRVPSHCSQNGKVWTNFGMNSQPLAKQWTAFSIAVESGFRVEMFIGKAQAQTSENEGEEEGEGDNDIVEYELLYNNGNDNNNDEKSCSDQRQNATKGTLEAISVLGSLLASLDDDSPLANGMHILSIPITSMDWISLPSPPTLVNESVDNSEGKGDDNEGSKEKLKLISIGTVEQDALELLDMGSSMLELSATSLLDVEVKFISPGSESEYIPDVYKPLYMKQ
jgi:hypothetical protein